MVSVERLISTEHPLKVQKGNITKRLVGRGGMRASTDNTGDLQSLGLTRAQPTHYLVDPGRYPTFRKQQDWGERRDLNPHLPSHSRQL